MEGAEYEYPINRTFWGLYQNGVPRLSGSAVANTSTGMILINDLTAFKRNGRETAGNSVHQESISKNRKFRSFKKTHHPQHDQRLKGIRKHIASRRHMGQERNRGHAAGKGALGGVRPSAGGGGAAAAATTKRGLGKEIALLVAFSILSVGMALYLSGFAPRIADDADNMGVVVVTRHDGLSKLAVPMRITSTVAELRQEVR